MGQFGFFGELLLISSSSALVTREGKLIKTTKEASWKDNHNSKQKSDSLCFYTSNHFTSESKVLFEQFNITFTTFDDFAITDLCFSPGKIGLVVSKKERQRSNNLSNTWQPRSRGRLNKCPRLFHPCFGLIHSEYGTQLIRN